MPVGFIIASIAIPVIGVAFGYGILNQKVKSNCAKVAENQERCVKTHAEVDRRYERIDGKLDDVCNRLSVIETLLRGRL